MNTKAKLESIFRKMLSLAPGVDFDEVAYRKTKGWDSVAHMQIVNEIESAFEIMIDTDDVIGMSSFPIALEILAKYGVGEDGA